MSLSSFPNERKKSNQLFPFPYEHCIVKENPPVFYWLPMEGDHTYQVVIKDENENIIERYETKNNYYIPNHFYEEKSYLWNVGCDNIWKGDVLFTIENSAPKIEHIDAETLYNNIPCIHPRHLFFQQDLIQIQGKINEITVLKQNVDLAYQHGMPNPPKFHIDENALPYREYFGTFRDYCDRDLIACALLFAINHDEKAGQYAKKLILCITSWDQEGPCSLVGNQDEIGLSLARCLPSAYDLLYPLFNPSEKLQVTNAIYTHAKQCFERLCKLNFFVSPGDSHAGRIPAYLGEAVLILKDSGLQTKKEAVSWLQYVLDIYGSVFPHYGTPDGGWAEGPFYATSYTKWYLPFFSAVERYGGTHFLNRPFYRNVTKFFLQFANPDYENHPFGDGYWCHSNDKEWPGFFAQNPFHIYAERFGPKEAVDWSFKLSKPEIYQLHLLDVFLPEKKEYPQDCIESNANTMAFLDAGFIAMHSNASNPFEDICLLARASKFGSDSHRHPDQGSFALFSGGKALISPSGYFGRQYGTLHHRQWLNSTKAHNAILVNGIGQKQNSLEAVGKILYVKETKNGKEALLDLTEAYPMLTQWTRKFVLTDKDLFVYDDIQSGSEVCITYPLHTLSEPLLQEKNVIVNHEQFKLSIIPIEGIYHPQISYKYDVDLNEGEPLEYHVKMPQQYHIYYTTEKKKTHTIVVKYQISKL